MADSILKNSLRRGEELYMNFDSLKFRLYSTSDIERLSVLHVTQIRTLDEVGHPIQNGLYDLRLGPTDFVDECQTCHLVGPYCPGHFGHIRLHLPVFNPVLFPFTYALLKGTCVHCHRFTCNTKSARSHSLVAQLEAVALSVPYPLEVVDSFVKNRFNDEPVNKWKNLQQRIEKYDDLNAFLKHHHLKNISTESLSNGSVDYREVKNILEIKRSLIKNFCMEQLFKNIRRCKLCNQSNGLMRNDYCSAVIIEFNTSSATKKRRSTRFESKFAGNQYNDTLDEDEDKQLKTKQENDIEDAVDEKANVKINSINEALTQQSRLVTDGTCSKLVWRAVEVREHFRTDSLECPMDLLFSETVFVPPTKFRPIRYFKGERFENPQTVNLRRLMEINELLIAVKMVISGERNLDEMIVLTNKINGETMAAKLHNAYLGLQQRMNAIFDQELDKFSDPRKVIPGIKQILEKKQGLFRMNMMGKRVNYACRSVITPDPYLDVDEVGIPELFAKKLTFKEFVGASNISTLRAMIKNGPDKHPGANYILRSNGVRQLLLKDKVDERFSHAKRLQPADSSRLSYPTQVLRHAINGDYILMNRQPTLHKPSIMGHRIRVLKEQRVLRLNYAPCKSYNADFDGDEMNGHFVQDRISQAEVAEIADVGSNFLVPKDGTPLLGLIQDHVVSGVLLTIRGRLFCKEDYMHLLLSAFAVTDKRIVIPHPCMLKPQVLWSGKQVITGILLNIIPSDKPLINLASVAKTPLKCWQLEGYPFPNFEMSESEVIFRQAELLVGVLDKQHFGSTQHGLIHCCCELYGHRVAMKILSCFSRLFSTYLQVLSHIFQHHGFSLGVIDILIKKCAEKERQKILADISRCGDKVVQDCFRLDGDVSQANLMLAMAKAYCNSSGDTQDVRELEFKMKGTINKFSEKINSCCVPTGLLRSFPENALQLMILSGAKGTLVNAIQISCCLGQIELEGKRPSFSSGWRTLPSFRVFDTSPRASGFIEQRFLTGIKPQELFFHTMAGREGLIDTAVKTSRSGYLQRCIVKHLEGLVLQYDCTVRDHDGSVIQFRYGEDGMDVCKASFLQPKQFGFFRDNLKALRNSTISSYNREKNMEKCMKDREKLHRWHQEYDEKSKKVYAGGFLEFSKDHYGVNKETLIKMWFSFDETQKNQYYKRAGNRSKMKSVTEKSFDALSEKMLDSVDNYINDNKTFDRDYPWHSLREAIYCKGLRSKVDPGENVGLLAAQSIGEPSTQMTLNTFHFAGRGEMNVTLGIPRLREILMTTGSSIKTPNAEIRARQETTMEQLQTIKDELDRIYLKQLIKGFSIDERVTVCQEACWRTYDLKIELLKRDRREASVRHVSCRRILRSIEERFVKLMARKISDKCKEMLEFQALMHRKSKSANMEARNLDETYVETSGKNQVDDGASSDEEVGNRMDADAAESRLKQRHLDDAADYEGEDDEKDDIGQETRIWEEETGTIESGSTDAETDRLSEEDDVSNGLSLGIMAEKSRIQNVLCTSPTVRDYKFDVKHNRWCVITFQVDLSSRTRLDVSSLVEREIETFLVSEIQGIEKCIIKEEWLGDENRYVFATQGINIASLLQYSDFLDINSLYSNDLNVICNNYGIEACAKSIIQEIIRVFTPYGINVDYRHLSLTADYMTFTGKMSPFTRGAMGNSASTLQKMTFETTVAFMRDAIVNDQADYLSSPSSCIVVGRHIEGGTGAFDLLSPLSYVMGEKDGGDNNF